MAALWGGVQGNKVQMGLEGQHRGSMLSVNQRKGATRVLLYAYYPMNWDFLTVFLSLSPNINWKNCYFY